MTSEHPDPEIEHRRGAARYLELLLFLGMGVVFLPTYALVTGVAWFITSRELFGTAHNLSEDKIRSMMTDIAESVTEDRRKSG